MRWWITRPGRAMALLAALAMWPAWVGLAMLVEWSTARGGHALAIAVTCGGLLAVAAWIVTQPSELVAVTARRQRFGRTGSEQIRQRALRPRAGRAPILRVCSAR